MGTGTGRHEIGSMGLTEKDGEPRTLVQEPQKMVGMEPPRFPPPPTNREGEEVHLCPLSESLAKLDTTDRHRSQNRNQTPHLRL